MTLLAALRLGRDAWQLTQTKGLSPSMTACLLGSRRPCIGRRAASNSQKKLNQMPMRQINRKGGASAWGWILADVMFALWEGCMATCTLCSLSVKQPTQATHMHKPCVQAVYVFVFNPEGELLMQRRSAKKKIAPGEWDLSVAEHLSPGGGGAFLVGCGCYVVVVLGAL